MAETDAVVLVTGATGYIATHVVKVFQDAGYKVRGTVRDLKNEKKNKHLYEICPEAKHKLELVQADLLDADSWKEAVAGCTYIMHVASPFPMASPKKEDDIIKPALDGTLNVLRAASKAGCVKKVVLTSSFVSVALAGGNTKAYTEEDWSDPNSPLADAYHKSKVLAERAAWDFVRDLPEGEKFELSVVNPVLVVGPTLHANPGTSTGLIQQMLERHVPAIPAFTFPCVDVRDVAKAHLLCLQRPEASGQRHIVHTKNMLLRDMALILDKEFRHQGYNVPTMALPGFLLTVACWFDSNIRGARAFAAKECLIDSSRMTKTLELDPIPIEESIVEMAYSMIDAGFVKKTNKYKGKSGADATS